MRRMWFCLAGILALLALALLGAFCANAWKDLDVNKMESATLTTFVYDRNGQLVSGVHAGQNREHVNLEELPEHVYQAFLAAEDTRFYRHKGVDPYRIAGAIWANIRSGSLAQGASTITQQLIKLTQLTPEKTFSRKIREAVMALRLETQWSKDQILESYLNLVYFGAGAYGVQTAARTYFQKDAAQLSIPEAATLAAILKSPSRYAPHLHPENAQVRRDLVLSSMAEEGYIDQAQYETARKTPIELNMLSLDHESWYVDAALDEACRILSLSRDELLCGGYRIDTAMDHAMQQEAEALFADASNFPANASDGQLTQAALIAVDPESGGVLALMGGREYLARGFNRATQMRRQPGSALKPVSVYAAAVDAFGYLPTSPILDAEKDYGNGYIPRNASGEYHGSVLLRQALSSSMNAAAVELISVTGVDAAADYARQLGIPVSQEDQVLALALGSLTDGATPMEMACAYAALGNGGYAISPHMVTRIEDSSGAILYEAQPQRRRAMRSESARLITSMLETAASTGTARALSALPFPVAGKTGTVGMEDGQNRDAWTVAYTPKVSVAVWMGFDMPDEEHAMAASISGGSFPARLAAQWLCASPGTDGGDFSIPDTLMAVSLDKTALDAHQLPLLASEYTPDDAMTVEYFPTDRAPTQISSLWVPPRAVLDARILENTLLFTAMSPDEEYVILQDGQEAAVLQGVYGQQLMLEGLLPGCVYEIYARNILLHQAGTEIRSPSVLLENDGSLFPVFGSAP